MHIDNSSPTCLIRVVHFYWWGGEFSSRMFFFLLSFLLHELIILGPCRSIDFFKATRGACFFFIRFSLTRIFIFCI